MKFSRSQKICFGVLGVGLVALAADRSLGGAGDPAVAAIATTAAGVTADVTTSPAAASPAAAPSLSARLRALVSDETLSVPVADAFKTSGALPAPNAPATDATVQAFKSAHALKAVLGSGRGGRVLLDDQLLAVGESVGGFELVDVRERHAVFAGPAGRVTVELPGPTVGR